MFAFALDLLENPKIIAYFDDVNTLESKKSRIVYRKIRLIGIDNLAQFKFEIEKSIINKENGGYIYTLDHDKKIINGTYIDNFRIVRWVNNDIILKGMVWNETPGYHKFLKMKLNNQINEKYLWRKLKNNELQGWLGFAFQTQRMPIDREDVKIELDGNLFDDLEEFFCLLGEEINGPGGYFGRNGNALADCFCGGFGVKSISEIKWINHKRSKELLKDGFDMVIDIFRERKNLTLILD